MNTKIVIVAVSITSSDRSERKIDFELSKPKQAFDDALDGDGLAGAGRARDQAVAVGALQFEGLRVCAAGACANEDAGRVVHEASRHFGEKLSRENRGGGRKIPPPHERRERDV